MTASIVHETVIDSSQHTIQSHALLRRGFGTSVPFIIGGKKIRDTFLSKGPVYCRTF